MEDGPKGRLYSEGGLGWMKEWKRWGLVKMRVILLTPWGRGFKMMVYEEFPIG